MSFRPIPVNWTAPVLQISNEMAAFSIENSTKMRPFQLKYSREDASERNQLGPRFEARRFGSGIDPCKIVIF